MTQQLQKRYDNTALFDETFDNSIAEAIAKNDVQEVTWCVEDNTQQILKGFLRIGQLAHWLKGKTGGHWNWKGKAESWNEYCQTYFGVGTNQVAKFRRIYEKIILEAQAPPNEVLMFAVDKLSAIGDYAIEMGWSEARDRFEALSVKDTREELAEHTGKPFVNEDKAGMCASMWLSLNDEEKNICCNLTRNDKRQGGLGHFQSTIIRCAVCGQTHSLDPHHLDKSVERHKSPISIVCRKCHGDIEEHRTPEIGLKVFGSTTFWEGE